MTAPLVSVVIPVHNGAQFLEQALASIDAQTYKPIEVIVIDDGSADESAEIARKHDPRPTVLVQPNRGVAAARNAGLSAARGDLIAFLDQDDWWRPAKIDQQVAVFLTDDDVGLVHTNVSHFDQATKSYTARLTPVAASATLVGRAFDRLVLGNGIYNSSVVVRRRPLDEVGRFDTSLPGNTVQDYDLWLRLAQCCSFAYVEDELTVFRLHSDQGTWKRRRMLTDELDLLDRHVGLRTLLTSPEGRLRVARLLDELVREHLAAGDAALARRQLLRLLQARPNLRSAALAALSVLPSSSVRWLLGQKAPRGHDPQDKRQRPQTSGQ